MIEVIEWLKFTPIKNWILDGRPSLHSMLEWQNKSHHIIYGWDSWIFNKWGRGDGKIPTLWSFNYLKRDSRLSFEHWMLHIRWVLFSKASSAAASLKMKMRIKWKKFARVRKDFFFNFWSFRRVFLCFWKQEIVGGYMKKSINTQNQGKWVQTAFTDFQSSENLNGPEFSIALFAALLEIY